jgi:hypothetical protein
MNRSFLDRLLSSVFHSLRANETVDIGTMEYLVRWGPVWCHVDVTTGDEAWWIETRWGRLDLVKVSVERPYCPSDEIDSIFDDLEPYWQE